MVTTPALALAGSLAAFHPHRRIRLRTFDRRIAQALGTLALSLLVAGAITGHPMVVASSLWAMTTTTILVVTLAPPEN
jgi:peptidoglycan/LPS O-acetylase OafA/YrhL